MSWPQPQSQASGAGGQEEKEDVASDSSAMDADVNQYSFHGRWGQLKIPTHSTPQGQAQFKTIMAEKIEPWVNPHQQEFEGGSGILDSTPATHYYVNDIGLGERSVLEADEDEEEQRLNKERAEQRAWYMTDGKFLQSFRPTLPSCVEILVVKLTDFRVYSVNDSSGDDSVETSKAELEVDENQTERQGEDEDDATFLRRFDIRNGRIFEDKNETSNVVNEEDEDDDEDDEKDDEDSDSDHETPLPGSGFTEALSLSIFEPQLSEMQTLRNTIAEINQSEDHEETLADVPIIVTDQRNLSVSQFIKCLFLKSKQSAIKRQALWHINHPTRDFIDHILAIKNDAVFSDEWRVQEEVNVPEDYDFVNGTPFDLQQFDWERTIGISPLTVRRTRDQQHEPFFSLKDGNTADYGTLPEATFNACFDPKSMLNRHGHRATTSSFQLRNQFAVNDHLSFVYTNGSKVWKEYNWHSHSTNSDRFCIINLADTANSKIFVEPVKISAIALSNDNPRSFCMVGGLNGEFAFKSILGNNSDLVTEVTTQGFATTNIHGSINHIDIDPYHNCNKIHAILSCNDNKIRTLDLETGLFLNNPGKANSTNGTDTGHDYPWPINCTASSPDGRLRIIVGDTTDVAIVSADTGYCERLLKGHEDFGFACAWSPDSRYVATGNQDRLCNIYDVRTWKVLSTFNARVSNFRSMKFSPIGGGARCLLLAEEADRVHVVDAQMFDQCQIHSFYGEVLGVDFNRDGSGFWVANGDEKFGGFMGYQRKGYGQQFGLGFTRQWAVEKGGGEFREEGAEEWIGEDGRRGDRRCVDPERDGLAGNWHADLWRDLDFQT